MARARKTAGTRTRKASRKKAARSASKKKAASPRNSTKPDQLDDPAPGLFDDVLPTDGKLYYRIGEVSGITGVKPYVLRYWESEFRWMAPQKSRSKQRLYRRKDIEMILLIRRLLHEQRYTCLLYTSPSPRDS